MFAPIGCRRQALKVLLRISTMASWAPFIVHPRPPVGAVVFMIAILRHSAAAREVVGLALRGHEEAISR